MNGSFWLSIAVLSAMLLWSPPVAASFGQCRWEGGPGAPTYPACREEDCTEDGGYAKCTEPEKRPPIPRGDHQADGEKFTYGMCDMAGPSIPNIALWCSAQGGTWLVSEGGGTTDCRDLPPQYPGVGNAVTEEAADVASDNWIDRKYSNCIATPNDSGWGFNNAGDNLCGGTQYYQNGYIVGDVKRRRYDITCPTSSTSFDIKITRARRLVCPDTYAMRTKSNGDIQCYIPSACCEMGNPVNLATGAKIQRESDYASADGLSFTRYYNSLGRYRVKGSGAFASTPGDYWRWTYARRLIAIAGNANVVAVVQNDDGSIRQFDATGKDIHNLSGGADRLQNLGAAGWQITLASSDVEHYDTLGRLTSVVTRGGVVTTLSYDGSGRLSSVSNSFGRALSFGYDVSDRLATLTLPGGTQIAYGYDSRDRLTTVTYPDGTTKTYHYENPLNQFLLTGITDETNTRFSTYIYDDRGRVQSEQHAGGANKYSFAIGNPNELGGQMTSTVTDPLGRSRQHALTRMNGVFRIRYDSEYCATCQNVSQASFDANGNYASKNDLNGRRTTYTYDLTRNLETSRTEGLAGNGTATPATRTVTTTWHATHRLPEQIHVYSGASATGTPLRRTQFTYDASGNVLTRTITDTTITPNVSRTWTYTYDAYGRVLTENGPRTDVSDVTTYTYYSCVTGYECGQLATVTNALNQTTTYNTYNAHGQPLAITDPNGVVTTLAYDARQRITFRRVGTEATTFEYWPTGLLKKVTQPDGSFLLHTYDAAHRLIRVEDGLGNRAEYTLDGMGNRQIENTYDPYGALVRTRTRLFNNLGQLWQELTATGIDSQATVFGYDYAGNQTIVKAPLGRTTTNVYDELSRLKQVTDPALGNTHFAYDANDNLTQVTDPRGVVTSYQYTGFGDVKQQVSPDTGTTINQFDSGGNLQSSTNARSAVTTHAYDVLNRVLSTSYRLGSTTDQTIDYAYDAGTHGKGRLSGASDANHSLTWAYDAQGRVTSKAQIVSGIAHAVVYGYTNGVLTSLVTPSGQSVAYTYSASGQLTAISVNGVGLLSNVVHDPFGPIAGWTWANGTLTVRSFDLDGRLELIDSAGLSMYTFHDDGSIASRSDDVPVSYVLPAGTTSMSVASTSNRLLATNGALTRTYSYDGAGNATSFGSMTFTYNFANRMSSSTQGGITTSYVYNALGQRIRKSSGASTLLFVYDEAGHLLGEYDGTGGLIQETVWLGDTPVATLRPNGAGGINVFYVHTDHLNTPRRVTRPTDNAIVWRWDSDPFGVGAANQDPDGGVRFVVEGRNGGRSQNYATLLFSSTRFWFLPSAVWSTQRSLTPWILRKDFSASRKPIAVQRSAISASR
jgi:YD repeat-containing protein